MKNLTLLAVLLFSISTTAFAEKKNVNTDSSNVHWVGKKIGGQHEGYLKIKDGFLDLSNGKIIAGEVIIDMSSLTVTDIEDADTNAKLVGHLKSDDFFNVAEYPTANFVVTSATPFTNGEATVSGLLNIKGHSEETSFVVKQSGTTYKAALEVDRSKYDVRYGSDTFFDNLGNKAIDDIFLLHITLNL